MVIMVNEETRKGPWTEEEDLQLVCSVGLLGDRRWDFIAKVSGLNRTGKSCRLRWVNYLHPGLKHGRMTPQEEGVVLELHSRWGNRWSRIARRLPGRTDNEIKNYWRTHMRQKAQERRRRSSYPALSPSSSSSCLLGEPHGAASAEKAEWHGPAGGACAAAGSLADPKEEEEEVVNGYPMEQIWDEIAPPPPSEMSGLDEGSSLSCPPMPSPPLGYTCDYAPWKMDDEYFKMFSTLGDIFASDCEQGGEP